MEADDQGRIEFAAFMTLLDGTWDDKEFSKNVTKNLYREFDVNKDGFIKLPEFKKLVAKLESITQREPSTTIELNEKFRQTDRNGNGKLSQEGLLEFELFYLEISSMIYCFFYY